MRKIFTLFTALMVALIVNATSQTIGPAEGGRGTNLIKTAIHDSPTDTIILKSGTYFEDKSYDQGYVDFKNSIVILAEANATPILKAEAYYRIKNGAKVKIKGVTFNGEEQDGYSYFIRFYDGNAENSLELEDCTFTSIDDNMIVCESEKSANFKYLVLKNCHFTGSTGKNAIKLQTSTPGYIQIENCQFEGFSAPIIVGSSAAHLDSCVIKNTDFKTSITATNALSWSSSNKLNRLYVDDCEFKGFTGVVISASTIVDTCIVKDCHFHGNTVANAINLGGVAKKVIISGSEFEDFTNNVIVASSTVDSCKIINCNFHDNATAGGALSVGGASKKIIVSGSTFEEFKGNVITTAAVDTCEIIDSYFQDNAVASAVSLGGAVKLLNVKECFFEDLTGVTIATTAAVDSCLLQKSSFDGGTKVIELENAAKHLAIDECDFSHYSGNVLSTSAVDTCKILNSWFHDNAVASAVSMGGAVKYLGVKECVFEDLTGVTIATSAAVDSCLLQNNFFVGGTKVIELGSAAKHFAVDACDFSNYSGIVLSAAAVDTCKILNSSFHDNAVASALSLGGAVKYLKINGSEFADFTGTTIATSAAVDSCDILNSTFNGGTKAIEISSKSSKSLYMNGCELSNYSDYVIHGPEATSNLAFCKIYNCYFHNCTNSAIYFEKTSSDDYHACDKLDIKYSTFANFSGFDNGLIEIYNKKETETADVELIVENCTFYNVSKTSSSSTYGVVDSRKSTNNSISNCIFANPSELASGEYAHKATQMYGGTVTKCLRHNVPKHRNTPSSGNDIQGDPKFVNASSGDFHLEEGSAAIGAATDGSDLGDPRWWTYGRGVTIGRFGTICLPYGVKAGTYSGATFYSIAGKRLDGSSQPFSLVLEIVSGDLKAGQPYFFEASAISLTAPYDGTPAEAGNYNGLFGTLVGLNSDAMDALVGTAGKDIYLLSNNTVVKAGTGCSLTANRAYIDMEKVPEYVEPSTSAPGIREIPMAPQSGTSLQNVENAETIVKFIENGRILIRRDGVTYDALGRVVR